MLQVGENIPELGYYAPSSKAQRFNDPPVDPVVQQSTQRLSLNMKRPLVEHELEMNEEIVRRVPGL